MSDCTEKLRRPVVAGYSSRSRRCRPYDVTRRRLLSPGGVSHSPPMWTRVPFIESHLQRVADFDCGSMPYQTEVSDWIKSRNGVLRDMAEFGTEVWFYETKNQDIIGFTSLGM